MRLHPNAKLTPSARRLLVQRIFHQHFTVAAAAEAAGVSRRTAHKWLRRFEEAGPAGLEDRSSRPHRQPTRTPPPTIRRIERLRRRRLTAWEIAARVAMPASTVSRILKRLGLGRLWRIDGEQAPPRRYEHPEPGAMLHIDAKKLGKIDGVGHRIHGDYRRRKRGVGWEVAFVCVDDHTRLAYVEVHPGETGICAARFLGRALKRFEALGISIERVLTDNAKAYTSNAFTELCAQRGVKHSFTRPYTPRTNGKAERFIQTLTRRWAHGRPYRTSALRTAALPAWLKHYNHKRPHRALGMKPPMARLREAREQRA